MFVSSVSVAVFLRPTKQICTDAVILPKQMTSVFRISLQKFGMLLFNLISACHCTEFPKSPVINVTERFYMTFQADN